MNTCSYNKLKFYPNISASDIVLYFSIAVIMLDYYNALSMLIIT